MWLPNPVVTAAREPFWISKLISNPKAPWFFELILIILVILLCISIFCTAPPPNVRNVKQDRLETRVMTFENATKLDTIHEQNYELPDFKKLT